jgi:hypothetical protein
VLTEITGIFHRALLGRMASLIILGVGLATAPNVCAQIGIASRYPNDKGIGSDPDVLLADDFESYTSTSQLEPKWTQAAGIARLRIATESGHYFAGGKGLEMKLPISTAETACGLVKNISPTVDTLFVRVYEKWDTTYHATGSNHNGILMSAKYPGPGTGTPADGTGWFLFQLDDDNAGRAGETDPGFDHVYVYWPKQRSLWGDLWYPDGYVLPYSNTIGNKGDWLAYPDQYPDFKLLPNFQPGRGRWYCYEMMVKANTPGQNDGEVKWWVDGKLIADFPNLNLRSIPSLKIDTVKITLDVNKDNAQVITKWHDNVVIATKYIGPMASGSPSPSPGTIITNISTRASVQTGQGVTIAGFIITGTDSKTVVLRGLGPTLSQPPFNIPGTLADPFLSLFDGSDNVLFNNNDWKDSQQAQIQATGLAPKNDVESAILQIFPPGNYTAILSGRNGTTGIGLVEVYDVATGAFAELTNVSTRGFVGTGEAVMIGGFITGGGNGSTQIVVRGLGPTLTQHGVTDPVLADPFLSLRDGDGNLLWNNNDWKDSQQAEIQATGLAPPNDLESAIVRTVAPGNYTAILSGRNGTTGIGLVEVYKLQ